MRKEHGKIYFIEMRTNQNVFIFKNYPSITLSQFFKK